MRGRKGQRGKDSDAIRCFRIGKKGKGGDARKERNSEERMAMIFVALG